MAGKNSVVFGIYRNRADAERAIDVLRDRGFRTEDISVLMPENLGSKDLAAVKATKAPEGTATGATAGAVIGGTLGLLAGIGALAIPGLGPLIAAGPILATLSGVGAGGAVGGITGALIGAGIPEYEAKRYEGRVKEGGILLSVHADSSEWISRAKDVLKQTGAEDIASTGESSADDHETDRPMPRAGAPTDFEPEYRQHYDTTYARSGYSYEEYRPAYQFGQRMASEQRYRGRSFNEVEPEVRRDYEREYPGSSWERMKDSVRYGWDRMTGRASRSATP